jgi:hypothetical protein
MGEGLTSRELSELRGRRWSADTAQRVLASWRASGLSMSAFGARHLLGAQRLGWWKKRLGDWGDSDAAEVTVLDARLVPAVVRMRAPTSDAPPVAIRLPTGIVIEVTDPETVSPSWLNAVLAGLTRPA